MGEISRPGGEGRLGGMGNFGKDRIFSSGDENLLRSYFNHLNLF